MNKARNGIRENLTCNWVQVSQEMFFIYSFLYFSVMLLLLPFEYRRRPKEIRGRWLREKFGFLNFRPGTQASELIWIHAVSMGEVISAAPFIRKLKTSYPSLSIMLSTITDTGQKVARERLSDVAEIIYFPFDLGHILRRTLRRLRPLAFIVMETELWPNTFRTLNSEGIRVIIMNGRLSENSFNGYKKIRFFIRQVIGCVDVFCMQDNIYAERVKRLGAREDRVKVTGNFKFDTKPSDKIPEWARALKGSVVVAGSTHGTEEDLILDDYVKLKKEFPHLNIVIAPRHPERFKEVEGLIKKKGLECLKVSEVKKAGSYEALSFSTSKPNNLVILLDVVGELASVYGICDIAIIGGSFIGHGGQNPLEPAFWGKSMVCGPHMENFPFMGNFYKQGGAVMADVGSLYSAMKELVLSPEKRRTIGDRALALYNEKSGAIDSALKIIKGYIHE